MPRNLFIKSILIVIISLLSLMLSSLLPKSHFRPANISLLTSKFSQIQQSYITTIPTAIMRFISLTHPHDKQAAEPYATEHLIALLAVQRASLLTRRVYTASAEAKNTQSKEDHSPVTVGDYGAQALIISALRYAFPTDDIIAEEDADDLRSNPSLRDAVWKYVHETNLPAIQEQRIGGPVGSVEDMLEAIDSGRAEGGKTGRVWTLDPIDGTKGFIRGGQYAIALGLVVDGQVQVGVLGCPNLPVDSSVSLDDNIGHGQSGTEAGRGALVSAVKKQGTWSRALTTDGTVSEGEQVHMRTISDLSEATFCEGVEAAHSNLDEQGSIVRELGITRPSVQLDSQAKYASIARGSGDVYLRLPVNKVYKNKIWDHAAGVLIVSEAGGKTTDIHGKEIDFGTGRELNNVGFVSSAVNIHDKVLVAVQKVLKSNGKL
jgi:3'(2'), 5'-bisphosphate nucleotidase